MLWGLTLRRPLHRCRRRCRRGRDLRRRSRCAVASLSIALGIVVADLVVVVVLLPKKQLARRGRAGGSGVPAAATAAAGIEPVAAGVGADAGGGARTTSVHRSRPTVSRAAELKSGPNLCNKKQNEKNNQQPARHIKQAAVEAIMVGAERGGAGRGGERAKRS